MKNAKVLVIDDEPSITSSIKYGLEKEGYTVITADNGSDGAELARNEKPDIVVLDVMLPGLDGYEVCRMIRADLPVPIIMLTAKGEWWA